MPRLFHVSLFVLDFARCSSFTRGAAVAGPLHRRCVGRLGKCDPVVGHLKDSRLLGISVDGFIESCAVGFESDDTGDFIDAIVLPDCLKIAAQPVHSIRY